MDSFISITVSIKDNSFISITVAAIDQIVSASEIYLLVAISLRVIS
jgi:hypothetical protein